MEIATTVGIVGVIYAFLEFIKFLVSKMMPDKTQDDISEIKDVVYDVKGSLSSQQIHSSYSAEAQKEMLGIIKEVSHTMQRMTEILDRIDQRHE